MSGRGKSWLRFGVAAALTMAVGMAALPAAHAAPCLLGAIGDCRDRPTYAPAPDPGGLESPDQPIGDGDKLFGFNLGYQPPGDADPAASLAAMRATGVQVLRYPVPWRAFKRTSPSQPVTEEMRADPATLPGTSTLRAYDRRYEDLVAAGITPLIILGDVPVWASLQYRCTGPLYAALNPSRCPSGWADRTLFPAREFYPQWRAFVAWAAQRWPQARLEGPNEPDWAYREDPDTAPSPGAAAEIQCELHRAAKAVDDRPVVSSAVSEPWYARGYLGRAKGCYEVYSFHPYPQTTELGAGSPLAYQFDALRTRRAEVGDTTPIWVTETGYAFVPGDLRPDDAAEREAAYADATRRLYNRLTTMDDVTAVLLHTLRDHPVEGRDDRANAEYHYGLFYEDWQPKPRACTVVGLAGGAWPGCPVAARASG